MPKTLETTNKTTRDERLSVPTKTEIIEALQGDSSRAGLQLEWMLDRCSQREGTS